MPSNEHEIPLQLVDNNPGLLPALMQRALHLTLPSYFSVGCCGASTSPQT
jgi:hypothetical protein